MELNILPLWDEEKTGPGRQRKRDGVNPDDGVRQLFELWFDEGENSTFSEFFKTDLSKSMRSYYRLNYIDQEGKSHDVYRGWRRDFDSALSADKVSAGRSKILSFGVR